jgi:hypothetical protein
MSSSPRGAATSSVDVTNISQHVLWVMVEDLENFVPFASYSAFLGATVSQIHGVRFLGPGQLSWPELDVDIELEALERPEAFPLTFR